MELRYYQQEAVDSVYDYLREHDDNPCVVLPTAAGKSLVLAQIAKDAVERWNGRVLILAHVKELLEQNADKIRKLCPEMKIGIYSAGLKSRQTEEPVIVAGIQSVYDKAAELGSFDLVIVDECHLIPPDGEGRYRTFIRDMKVINPIVRIIGLTATPYRLNGGAICRPENILNAICYEAGVKELLEKGFLCPLISKETRHVVDTSSLHVRGGEFVESEAEKLMNDKTLIEQACAEINNYAKDRHSVLVFCCSILHATEVMKELRKYSDSVDCVFGDTFPEFREERLEQFRAGKLKYLVNVGVLTTGFDAPNTDCVVLLRPTASPGLYYQMVGRGFRLSPTKSNTLVLDFGGNIVRHGPVDSIRIRQGRGFNGPAGKTCPRCQEVVPANVRICRQCGYEFESSKKNDEPNSQTITHDPHASSAGIISGQVSEEEYEVREVNFYVHRKRGAPPGAPKTVRIEYKINMICSFSEWLCPEHGGFIRKNFERWWKKHAPGCLIPYTAEDAVWLATEGAVEWPSHITVRTVSGEKYPKVVGYRYPEKQPQPQIEQEEIPF